MFPGDSPAFGSFHDFASLGHDHERSHDRPLVDADARQVFDQVSFTRRGADGEFLTDLRFSTNQN